jgi:hypothetical protein
MKNTFYFLFSLLFATVVLAQDPCTTSNATGCLCPDGSVGCDLLPDITIAEILLLDPLNQPERRGELRVSIATPNIGWGPLTVAASDYYVCGTDTIYSPGINVNNCADGTAPRQLIKQKVYHKDNGTMTNYDRWAGSMTYHPTHFHMHVDAWCNFSLRNKSSDPNPLNWPIVVSGEKLGFCLMDYGSCDYYDGYCVDNGGTVRNSSNQINYGLGGGEYSCGLAQGISVGFTDIYHYYLDDMDIQIPPDVCDGDYYLVVQVDPNNNFAETDETNNVMAIPFSLSKQNYKPEELLTATGVTTFCKGDAVELQANHGALGYLWSTGDTTNTIQATETGLYTVTAYTYCGAIQSTPIQIQVDDVTPTMVNNDSICSPTAVTLSIDVAQPNGVVKWYEDLNSATPIAEGTSYTTPVLSASKTYYVQNEVFYPGQTQFNEPHDNLFGLGGYNSLANNGYEIFDVLKQCELVSIKVYAQVAGERTIQVLDEDDNVLHSATVNLPQGESRANLNFMLQPGSNFKLKSLQHPQLYRNNSNVTYPYVVNGYVSIKASNYDDPANGDYYYYYYYDWEVKELDRTCVSEPMPVSVFYTDCVGMNDAQPTVYCHVSPNPAHNQATISMQSNEAQQITLTLQDLNGKTHWSKSLGKVQGAISHAIPLQNLPQGLYLVRIDTEKSTYTEKLNVY